MDLVVDANILFAALIKESKTSNLLFSDNFHLYTVDFVFNEFEKHKEEILEKTKRTTKEFYELLNVLKRRIIVIPLEELNSYIKKAEGISPDPNDVAYFALALKLYCAIWSNDKKLKEQNEVKIYATHDLEKI